MRKFTIAIAALSVLTLATAAKAQVMTGMTTTGASATYDPATGGITFDGFDDGELGIKLISASGALVAGATDLNGAAGGILGVVNESEIPNFIEWGQLAGFNFASEFGGNVITQNTDPSDLTVEVAITPTDFETLSFMSSSNPTVAALADVTIDRLGGDPINTELNASASTGDSLSFAFDVDGDGTFETDNGNNPVLPIADFRDTFEKASFVNQTFPIGVQVTGDGGVDTATATVTVLAVPEPAALALVALGLVGFAGRRRNG